MMDAIVAAAIFICGTAPDEPRRSVKKREDKWPPKVEQKVKDGELPVVWWRRMNSEEVK